METINNVELNDPDIYPDDDVLKDVLGDGFEFYLNLLEIYREHGLELEWRFYKDGGAWLCKVVQKKRTIVWMSAWKGFMQASVYMPVRLLDQLFELDLGEEVLHKLRNTRDVGKSKPCIFDVTNREILEPLLMVMQFKMKNR